MQTSNLQSLVPTTSQFVTGEIVYWKSANPASNRDFQGVVKCVYHDEKLGEWALVQGKLRYPQLIRVCRLNRPAFGPTLCGPGKIA